MGKSGITAVKYYNKNEDISELWQKLNDAKRQAGHFNIADSAFRIIRKYCGKKAKDITEKEKKIQSHF